MIEDQLRSALQQEPTEAPAPDGEWTAFEKRARRAVHRRLTSAVTVGTLVVASAFFAAARLQQSPDDFANDLQRRSFTDSSVGFTIDVPRGWEAHSGDQLKDARSAHVMLMSQPNGLGPRNIVNVRATNGRPYHDIFLAEEANQKKQFKKLFASQGPEYGVPSPRLSTTAVQVGGRPALRIVVTTEILGSTVTDGTYVVDWPHHWVLAINVDTKVATPEGIAETQRIMDSIKPTVAYTGPEPEGSVAVKIPYDAATEELADFLDARVRRSTSPSANYWVGKHPNYALVEPGHDPSPADPNWLTEHEGTDFASWTVASRRKSGPHSFFYRVYMSDGVTDVLWMVEETIIWGPGNNLDGKKLPWVMKSGTTGAVILS